jgi:putative FmdB family regulatory protein
LYYGSLNRIKPIYEYYCEECKSNFELIQKVIDAHLKKCNKCIRKVKVIKLLIALGYRVNGYGWHDTEFKWKSKKNIFVRN